MTKINCDTAPLGGLISQAALLAGLSDGREANPVKRGAFVARKIIAKPPDDPPPNVPELTDDTELSLRERLEKHRSVKGCAKCHESIDPYGFPLEAFDAGGRFQNRDVDASSTLPDGTLINSFGEFQEYLSNSEIDQVAFSFLKHLSTYAIGRQLTYNELRKLQQDGLELRSHDYRMKDMIHFIVDQDFFRKK